MSLCVHITIINEKRGHGFEREGGGVYGRVWGEERGGNYVIIL